MSERKMLGEFIYNRRKELGMSQAELGRLVGVSNKAVSKWETEEANPDIGLLNDLSKALKCSIDELLSCQKDNSQDGYKHKKVMGYEGLEINNVQKYEFISDKKNKKGLPKLHIHFGKTLSNANCKAKGTIAIGNIAEGKISIGFISKGLISIGILSVGLISIGVLAIGLLVSLGAFAISLGVSIGAIAVGLLAIGAVAIGVLSIGALSIGVYAHTSDSGYAIGMYEYIHNKRIK